jgi:two-component system alkaline phosphatase synthesis response regulator PhoP
MKALVVDHDTELRDLLTYTLRRHGYAVVTASNAVQAIEHWRVQAPDLVLLEPALWSGDGLAVCRQIRQASATPVLLVTTRGSHDDVQQGLAAGASDYVLKPFSPRQLMARIQLILEHAERSDGAPAL